MTIDEWLSKIYKIGIRSGADRTTAVAELKAALDADDVLKTAAQKKLIELQQLVAARGAAACAFSNWYRIFLEEALT